MRPARAALTLLGSGLALALGATPASAGGAPFPKPTPKNTAIAPGAVTRDPSTAQRSSALAASAQQAAAGVADTPLLGWSSWSMESSTRPGLNPNGSGSWLTQANQLKQVDAVAENLKPSGYQYINIDAGWSRDITGGGWDTLHFDANGREIASPQRFPDGMKPVADYIHSKGLKAGIYLAVGLDIPAYNGGKTPIADAPGPSDAGRQEG